MAALDLVAPPYPSHWEADVVLSDGGTVHLRPIRPEDGSRLTAMHSRLSEQTIYYRYFGPYPRIPDRDLEHFTHIDYRDRMALVAMLGDDIIAVGRYERLPDSYDAEVAFTVEDAHQGRGIGTVLLEHLTAIAREWGIRRFVADVLAGNRRMIKVFLDAGYSAQRRFAEDTIQLSFPIEETEQSLEVARAREHRAEQRSVSHILTPSAVAVFGASQRPGGVGRTVLANLLDYGLSGPVYPVHPSARHVASVRAYSSVLDIPDDVDLAVVAIPAEAVSDVVRGCARKGVRGLVVISSFFGEAGPRGVARQRELVRVARANGMRVVGPNCLGVINTDPRVRLNASLAPVPPQHGRVGFFSQSGAFGIAILEEVKRRGIGLSTFVSAGNRADVSANDLLQYWEEDAGTEVVLLYIESFGNPRKFARIARRLTRRKPIVAVKSGRATAGMPLGHRSVAVRVPDEAVEALFRQAGVIRVDTIGELLDVAQVLAYQPLPKGRSVAIVGNSSALGVLAVDAALTSKLKVAGGDAVDLGPTCTPEDFRAALEKALADPDVHAVVTLFIPPLATSGAEVARVLAEATAGVDKPVVTVFLAFHGVPESLRVEVDGGPGRGSIPSFYTADSAVASLARAVEYAEWRARRPATVPELSDISPPRAEALVERVLADAPEGRELDEAETARLFATYGVSLWPAGRARTADEAVAAAQRLSWPVVLKAREPWLRHRVDLGGVRLDLTGESELRAAFAALREVGASEADVQRMAPPGLALTVTTLEDPSFGVLVSLGVAGPASELLGDRTYRALPLTDFDAREMVRSLRAAPLLFGWRGSDPVDVAALEDLLLRVARLADHLPEVAEVELNPVLVERNGLAVLEARVRVAPARPIADTGPRRLR